MNPLPYDALRLAGTTGHAESVSDMQVIQLAPGYILSENSSPLEGQVSLVAPESIFRKANICIKAKLFDFSLLTISFSTSYILDSELPRSKDDGCVFAMTHS